MIYTDKEQEETAVNQAWNQLYSRFEKDGLLPAEGIYGVQHKQFKAVRWLSVAAVIAICIFTGWYMLQKNNLPDERMRVQYNEALSPTLATMLEDGSVVYLSAQTSLRYPDHFKDNKREVALQGEAFFEVKKQVDCPFIIHTDVAVVEVTGTSFMIKSDQKVSFSLTVHDGEVQVKQKNSVQALIVEAGETVFFDSKQWQLMKGVVGYDDYFNCFHFKDEYLSDVATIINMHLDTLRLHVDPAIKQRITFTFKKGENLIETVEAICLALNLCHSRQGDIISISK